MRQRSAIETLAALRAGRLSAEALMGETLERIAEVNPKVNAIVSLRDAEALMAEARAADRSEPVGPLHGLPMAIKDLADVAGMPTSMGSPLFAGQVAEADSLFVARLRAAGAIFVGKTNAPEFGLGSHTFNEVFGATRNPYDPSRSAGGSSGGAGVALATKMVALADGSDAMGSLRNPAAWNNVYGMRPTWGLVPGEPEGELFLHQLTTDGPMARSPADLALLLGVMAGPDARLPYAVPMPDLTVMPEPAMRIGWLGDWGGALPCEAGIMSLMEAALGQFEGLGAAVEPVPPPFPSDAIWESWLTLRAWDKAGSLGALDQSAVKPEVAWEVARGVGLSAAAVQAASVVRSDWFAAAMRLFERYDVLALPSTQVWPFDVAERWPREIDGHVMDTYHRWMQVVVPASLLGLPVVAIPAGFGAAGLPGGMQLIGRKGDDGKLLRLAEAWHRATDWPGRGVLAV
jgi:amidase